jgi:FAD/FMN-containing dehydrogenase
MSESMISALQNIVGADNVLLGDDVTMRDTDWGTHSPCHAKAIVRPSDTEEVAAVMRLCHQRDQKVVPFGGLTNLVGGCLASPDEIALSLERMNRVEEVDVTGSLMVVQAGTPLQTAQEAADKAGLFYPIDFGARGSCTVGGHVSTNAGGSKVIRHGMTRENVLGLETVLADGTVLSSMNRFLKNNSGFDLKHLFIGAEGLLGIVTRIVMRLRAKPASHNVAFLAFESFEHIIGALELTRHRLSNTLSGFEVMWGNFIRLNANPEYGLHIPLSTEHAYYVLIEGMGADLESDDRLFQQVMEALFVEAEVRDGVIAKSDKERAAIWAIREHVEILAGEGIVSFDVSLPIAMIERYVKEISAKLASENPDSQVVAFGHLGDNNIHLGVEGAGGSDAAMQRTKEIVYGALAPYGGAVSAEHGIGLEKVEFLPISRAPEEIELMRRLKRMMDPKDILNAGKVLG